VPELLAVALYEVFADLSDETTLLRFAVCDLWRSDPEEKLRTMGFLAAQDTRTMRFAGAFVKTLARAYRELIIHGIRSGQWGQMRQVSGGLASRIRWLLSGTLRRNPAGQAPEATRSAEQRYGAALRASSPGRREISLHSRTAASRAGSRDAADTLAALERGVERLISRQSGDGSWEGEVVWCPILAAQYVLACHIMNKPIEARRKDRLLRHFEETRLPSGAWGLHELSEPYLFVTALVYVASRILGCGEDHPLLAPARRFIRNEGGVASIPTWGKFWLAMLDLYPWEGVNPIPAETWALPAWLPAHPSKHYCHTRQIYLAMATIYGQRFKAPRTPLIHALRDELWPEGYDSLNPSALRSTLRSEEVHAPPGRMVRLLPRLFGVVEDMSGAGRRARILGRLREHIRFELRATDHSSISPVSGLLNMIALWIHDPKDSDLEIAQERFERWIWEDDVHGTRVAGARSATWDTAFAARALAAAGPSFESMAALNRADEFLRSQQIRSSPEGHDAFCRTDPAGGYCFGNAWHGWPVSDCTAEALLARLSVPECRVTGEELNEGVRFILRCQNADGGFGSYEAGRGGMPLEWLNPSEMFRGSMRDGSSVECTASSVAALSRLRDRCPEIPSREIDVAVAGARKWLRLEQLPDGSWPGSWGVHFIYGTMFGVRGLLASGVPSFDPRIRTACSWLRSRQRADGGWGEHHSSCLSGSYREHHQSQVIQTAWAMTALLEALDPDWTCLERGARFLASMQHSDGDWPKQDPAGVFFRTALLDYTLYRSYFPVRALALFEERRRARTGLGTGARQARRELVSPGPAPRGSTYPAQPARIFARGV
jgi:lanosterol synthase